MGERKQHLTTCSCNVLFMSPSRTGMTDKQLINICCTGHQLSQDNWPNSVWNTYFTTTHWLRYRQDGTIASPATVRYCSRRGYGAVNTISFLLSVTRLVLTPALTLNDPLCPKFTTVQHNQTGFNPNS